MPGPAAKKTEDPFRRGCGAAEPPGLSPLLRLAHDYRIPQGTGRVYEKPCLGDHALHYFAQGDGLYRLDGATYRIAPRSVFLVRPGRSYRFELRDGAEVRMLNLHFDLEEGPFSSFPFPCPESHWKGKLSLPESLPSFQALRNYPVYEAAFFKLYETASLPGAAAALRRKSALLEIFASLHENALTKSSGLAAANHSEAIERALSEISKRPEGRFSLDSLAKAAGVSRALLCRVFKEATGLSPRKYVLRRKVELASAELLYGRSSIKEIAFRCGFPDVQSFSKVFKRVSGESPARFRESRLDIYE